jgi:glyoxylase-like metal-dependent hydrolase (beta-lactamase superfamily II)
MAFEYGVVQQVSPLIRRVVARNPGPFTFHGTGTYIVGHGEVAVLDPGPEMVEHLDALLAATTGERVTHVFITHAHMDHTPLARPLAERTGATIYAGAEPCIPSDGEVRLEAGDDLDFRPDVALTDGEGFTGPDWTLRAMNTPGHTSSHYAFLLEQEHALFTGDCVMGWSTTVISPPDGDMGDYMRSLARVQALAPDTLWPTHGPPVTEPGPFLAAYVAHRRGREAQILDALSEQETTIRALVPRLYAHVERRLHPAASHSMLAHLTDLVDRGLVRCDGAPGIASRYARAA